MPETCCGQRPGGQTGAPLRPACQLCPHAPTYWRGAEHVTPAPPPAPKPAAAAAKPATITVAPPMRVPPVPGECGTGNPRCGAPGARLYPGGWRCDEHAPAAGHTT